MILGPHALSLVNQQILDAHWYQTVVHIFECAVGLMIGTELVWRKLRQIGKSIIVTTLTQSLGTFVEMCIRDRYGLEQEQSETPTESAA